MKTKSDLLLTGVFIDNDYLDKYIALINNSLTQTGNSCKHHIIPRCYYKYNNLIVDDTQNNLVNLSYIDHILAHYYLWGSLSDKTLKYKNAYAVCSMIKENNSNAAKNFNYTEEEIIKIITKNEFDKLYSSRIEYLRGDGNPSKQDYVKAKISKALKGMVISEETRRKLSKPKTEEHKRKLSEAKKGKKYGPKKKWTLSEASKEAIRQRNYGKHWYNNGVKETFSYVCPESYEPGRLKLSEDQKIKLN